MSNGTFGWVQVTNFVVTGLLLLAFAVGVRRVLHGRAATWGPRMLGAFGVGMIVAGIFRADPSMGFPIGAPAGTPETITVAGIMHGVGAVVAFTAFSIACFVFARRYFSTGERTQAWIAIAAGVAVFVIPGPGPGASIRMAVGAALAFVWVFALARKLRQV